MTQPYEEIIDAGRYWEAQVSGKQEFKDKFAASKMGMSYASYKRARWIVDQVRSTNLDAARQVLKELNESRNVYGAYQKLKLLLNKRSYTERITITSKSAQERAIQEAILSLNTVASVLNRMENIHSKIDPGESAEWVRALSNARGKVSAFISRLRKHSQQEGVNVNGQT